MLLCLDYYHENYSNFLGLARSSTCSIYSFLKSLSYLRRFLSIQQRISYFWNLPPINSSLLHRYSSSSWNQLNVKTVDNSWTYISYEMEAIFKNIKIHGEDRPQKTWRTFYSHCKKPYILFHNTESCVFEICLISSKCYYYLFNIHLPM